MPLFQNSAVFCENKNMVNWASFFLIIASQGIFLSLLLFNKKSSNLAGIDFLGLFILTFSVILLFWRGYWMDLHLYYQHFNLLFNPLPLLLGPTLLLYLKGIRLRHLQAHILHFLPFILVSAYGLISMAISGIGYDHALNLDTLIIYPLHSISFILYSMLSLGFYRSIKKFQLGSNKTDLKPQKVLIAFFGLFSFFSTLNLELNANSINFDNG